MEADNWKVLDPRRAGRITRYHTWPRIQQQSNGEHSWQLQRILLAIWPDVPREILVHAITHDIGEIATGDLPFPAKARDPELKKKIDEAERSAHLRMCLPWTLPGPSKLSEEETATFKYAEFIEMWEWALDDYDMGNRNAELVRQRCIDAMLKMRDRVPKDIVHNALAYMTRRVAVCGPSRVAFKGEQQYE
jgi:hypothetical protein